MNLLPLAVLLALSAASAAPLLGSRASVAGGSFCTAHGCTLTGREEIAPDLLGYVSYTYRLHGGAELVVLRDVDKTVLKASLFASSSVLTGNLGRDFSRSFVGQSFEPSAVARCTSRATDAGVNMWFGKVGNAPYTLACYTINERLIWSAEVERDGPTF